LKRERKSFKLKEVLIGLGWYYLALIGFFIVAFLLSWLILL